MEVGGPTDSKVIIHVVGSESSVREIFSRVNNTTTVPSDGVVVGPEPELPVRTLMVNVSLVTVVSRPQLRPRT